MSDNSLALALVYAWLLDNPEAYCSWVNPYTQLRWHASEKRMLAVRVGGHWRRLSDWASLLPRLRCVCKFDQTIAKPRYMQAPVRAVKQRWDESGEIIPRKYRVTIFL